MTWHAVDAAGLDLATGRAPRWPGWPSPVAAVAAAPVASWPLAVVGEDGRRLSLAGALGPGGDRVEALLEQLTGLRGPNAMTGLRGPNAMTGLRGPNAMTGLRGSNAMTGGDLPVDVEAVVRDTPAGPVTLPLRVVALEAGVEATAGVDRHWLAEVDRAREVSRYALVAAGREADLEAAVHVAILVATERLDPADDADVDAHAASGAQLWLLAGAVVSALAGAEPDLFESWARLVAAGWWPVGPSAGRLVLSAAAATLGGRS